MLIHPWDAALDATEWQSWLASTDRFGNVADNILLVPGTSSLAHLEENLAVADIELDEETRRELTAVA